MIAQNPTTAAIPAPVW